MGIARIQTIRDDIAPQVRPVIVCPAAERATLDFLRATYLACRSKPRHDLFTACELLTFDRHAATSTYAEAFLRTLPQIIGTRPKMLRPGDTSITFDEAWVLALLRACGAERHDDVAFLSASRVTPAFRPNLVFLIGNLSRLLEIR